MRGLFRFPAKANHVLTIRQIWNLHLVHNAKVKVLLLELLWSARIASQATLTHATSKAIRLANTTLKQWFENWSKTRTMQGSTRDWRVASRNWVPRPKGILRQNLVAAHSCRGDLGAVGYIHTVPLLDPLLVTNEEQWMLLETLLGELLVSWAEAILVAATMVRCDAPSNFHNGTWLPNGLLEQLREKF